MSPTSVIKKGGETIAPWVNLVLMVCLAITGYLLVGELQDIRSMNEDVQELREFMAETKGNRFTDDEGLEVWKAIAELKSQIAGLPNEPPAWFQRDFEKLSNAVGEVHKTVNDNSQKIIRVQADVEILKKKIAAPSAGG